MEAYLKKLCFEYQVDEKEDERAVGSYGNECIWIKEKRLLLPQCPSRACTLLFPVSCIHLLPSRERTKPSDSCPKGMLYCAIIPVSMLSKALTKCAAYYISEEEIEELCATSITFANLVRQTDGISVLF